MSPLTPQQQLVVAHDRGAALVFATAGAGKTMTMTARIERLVRQHLFRPGEILATAFNRDAAEAIKRNFSVILNDDQSVRRVIEKPRKVPNRLKGCGLYMFDDRIFEAVRRTPRTAMRDEYELTDSIQILIDYEYPVYTAPVVNWDINLTFIGDLIRCCTHELSKKGITSLVGERCSIAEGTTLINTVVGNDVTIEHPVTLTDCVLLDHAVLTTNDSLTRVVVSPEAILTEDT